MLEQVIKSGAVVNFVLVVAGGLLGLLLRSGIPERVRDTMMKGMALCVFFIGVSGLITDGVNALVVIISVGIGAVIGELADPDKLLNRLGERLSQRFGGKAAGDGRLAEGFVSATLLFCVGAMTVVGSISSGISGDNSTLYSKSLIDAITAALLTSSLGAGVMLAAVSVLVIEGTLTLLASAVQPVLTAQVVTHMSVIGSLLIIAISLNMLGLTKIKTMNLLPGVFLPVVLCLFL